MAHPKFDDKDVYIPKLIHHYDVTLLRDLGPFKKGRKFSEAFFELESENPVIQFVEFINDDEEDEDLILHDLCLNIEPLNA